MNLIHGQHTFRVAGFNMVLSDEGAAVFMQNAQGVTFQVVVDEVVSKQLFKAHTAELLPAGDYKLVVKSRAGDAAGQLQTSFRRVKYLRVEDPPVPIAETEDGQVKIMTLTDGGESSPLTFGHEWAGTGSGFQNSEAGWYVELAILRPTPEGEPIDVGCLATSDTALTVTSNPEAAPAAGDYPNATLDIGFAHDDAGELVAESLTIPIHLVVG